MEKTLEMLINIMVIVLSGMSFLLACAALLKAPILNGKIKNNIFILMRRCFLCSVLLSIFIWLMTTVDVSEITKIQFYINIIGWLIVFVLSILGLVWASLRRKQGDGVNQYVITVRKEVSGKALMYMIISMAAALVIL